MAFTLSPEVIPTSGTLFGVVGTYMQRAMFSLSMLMGEEGECSYFIPKVKKYIWGKVNGLSVKTYICGPQVLIGSWTSLGMVIL